MEAQLALILDKLDQIDKEMKKMRNELRLIREQTTKMDQHVDFVDSVYEKVENPLNFICEKFNGYIGCRERPTDLLEQKG